MTTHLRSTRVRSALYLAAVVALWAVTTTPASGRGQPPAAQTKPASPAGQSKPSSRPAQPPAAGAPSATFKAGVNFVRVDVIVTDKHGRPVTSLKPSDFQVYENGRLQKIQTFRLVRISTTPQPEGAQEPATPTTEFGQAQAASNPEARVFVIFLDDYHVRRGDSIKVRQPLEQFVEQDLGPNDLVGVMYPLTPLSDITLTADHASVVEAIKHFVGRKYDFTPRNQFEEKYADLPTQQVVEIRNEVTLSALRGLMTYLGSLRPGRKAVVLVSEGYTNVLPPQLQNPVATMPGFGNPEADNPLASDANNPTAQAVNFFSNIDIDEDLRVVYSAANRNNTSIYTLDPRGLATSEFDISQNVNPADDQQILQSTQDTLRTLASETDGRAIVNRNDMTPALEQIVKDSSDYYLLGYNSNEAADGKFHKIEVRVTGASGLRVRARKGYWALTAAQVAQALAPPKLGPPPAVETALATVSTERHGQLVRTWIGTSRGTDGKSRVTFVWQPIPTPFGERVRPDREPARVVLTALSRDGAPDYQGAVPPEPPGSAAAPSSDARGRDGGGRPAEPQGPSRVVFQAAPGTIRLHLSVQGADGRVLDFDDVAVQVPDFTKPGPALSTPEVFSAQTAYQLRQLLADPGAVPTASRQFARGTQLLLRFQTYGPGGTMPPVTAQLLNRGGQSMAALPVAPGRIPGTDEINLPLDALPPGDFLVQIKATSGGSEATQLVAFRVVG
ncbi:MAG TPA: VWA domain-containing protein [Vicinamibacterales bacterium]|nr:VWA domain-containing protein [Vicinamibacterales bacterium]